MDKHCRICHNTSCSNHGKNISFLGEGWKCNYIPVHTNADRIRSMSDEEITEFVCRNGINTLCDIICGGECNAIASFKKSGDEACKEIVMKWLQQPAEEE